MRPLSESLLVLPEIEAEGCCDECRSTFWNTGCEGYYISLIAREYCKDPANNDDIVWARVQTNLADGDVNRIHEIIDIMNDKLKAWLDRRAVTCMDAIAKLSKAKYLTHR